MYAALFGRKEYSSARSWKIHGKNTKDKIWRELEAKTKASQCFPLQICTVCDPTVFVQVYMCNYSKTLNSGEFSAGGPRWTTTPSLVLHFPLHSHLALASEEFIGVRYF